MAAKEKSITWEAPEHHHIEKGSDWYWVLGILALAGTVTAVLFGNLLFAIVIVLGAMLMTLVSLRGPDILTYTISTRGVRVEDELYTYSNLSSFCINEEDVQGPQLLLRSKGAFQQLIVIPLPEEAVEHVDDMLAARLPEEHLEESLAHKLLEFFGF